ncbi:Myoglobin, putative [Perkinsus marinus ATCC 50983]|nr:Myoglobin, putative [Perkinsus marinus ATCC 50983]EER01883.1 Myoglobin, putative [Perkinsus marinus ATCC 50983]|eukprot:XP_002769165.1 Myoglobin, putative [Perkinsus marinus ATCC 50983]
MNLEAVVETMYSGALLDPRIKFFFDLPKDRVEQIKERMCTFLSMITGAPEVKYDVKALKEIHRGINITDYHFDALMENMKVACELMEIDNTVRVDFLECVSHVRGIITAGCTVRLELAKRRTEIGGTEGLFKQLGGEEGIAKAVQRLYE